MAFSKNLRKYRLALGISQVALATAIGVTKQCISNWENDNILPSIEMLTQVADFFSVTTDELLGRCNGSTLSLDGLDEDAKAHIRALVNDLRKART